MKIAKKVKTIVVIVGLSLGLVSTAMAHSDIGGRRGRGNRTEKIMLQMNDQETRGASTIALKQLLRQQTGTVAANLELVSIRIIAKSRMGQGQASLLVGQWESGSYTIGGNPRDFRNSAPYTYDRINMENYSYDSDGRWQIRLKGNIKVSRVVVVVKAKRGGYGGGRSQYETIQIKCESNKFRENSCSVPGTVVDVDLAQQYSDSSCRKGRSFGPGSNSIWVSDGCRGSFNVTYQTRSRRY